MKSISAKEAKTHFGQMLETVTSEVVEITRNGRPSAYVLSPEAYKRMRQRSVSQLSSQPEEVRHKIVEDFAGLRIDRHEAMQLLGIQWYGDLLDLIGDYGLALGHVDQKTMDAMVKDFLDVVGDRNER